LEALFLVTWQVVQSLCSVEGTGIRVQETELLNFAERRKASQGRNSRSLCKGSLESLTIYVKGAHRSEMSRTKQSITTEEK
jgi:hypothetical protein